MCVRKKERKKKKKKKKMLDCAVEREILWGSLFDVWFWRIHQLSRLIDCILVQGIY
jgi:hypothetical protein